MIQYIKCLCDDCKHNDGEGNCTIPVVSIDWQITASGWIPACEDHEEKEEDDT